MNNDQLFRQALQRQNERAAQLKMPDNMEERVMQRIQATEKASQLQPSRKIWMAAASAIAIAAGILLLIVFHLGKDTTEEQPLVAQKAIVQPVVQPTVEVSQPELVADGQPEEQPEAEVSEATAQTAEPTLTFGRVSHYFPLRSVGLRQISRASSPTRSLSRSAESKQISLCSHLLAPLTEKVEEPRHFTSRPVLGVTSPRDEPFFLASTSYMVAPKSYRNGIAEESAESEKGYAIQLPTKTASQKRPQIPSAKDNFNQLTKKERRQVAVLGAIDTKRWHIDITTMSTMRYGSRAVTPDFYLELRGDTLLSYLPYLGQARVSPMLSPTIGLNFEEPVRQYKESRPKSKYTRLDIDVRTREDSYHYVIDIYDSGEANIRVSSLNRDPISFDGTLETKY